MRLCFRSLSLHEILAELEAEEDDVDPDRIYIQPPAVSHESDEDSGEEDGGGTVNNLAPRILQADAEAVLRDDRRIGLEEDIYFCSSSVSDEKQQKRSEMHVKTKNTVYTDWKREDIQEWEFFFPENCYANYRKLSPSDLFELFWDDSLIDFLIEEATRYALFKNCSDPKITSDEMKSFIAILILSGYNQHPSRRHFWDSQNDMRNELVFNVMRRDRFECIMRFTHCCDNTKENVDDKMWKLRPIMDLLKKRFLEHFQPEQNLDYDECMIQYFGRHGCKQFLKGKPIRFGYKVWCMNTREGYLVNFEVYQGRNPRRNEKYEQMFGKCSAPMVQMLDELPNNCRELPFRLYFDNLFTGQNLLVFLRERGIAATGTVRDNRVPKGCKLPSIKVMSKKKRGEYEFASSKESGIVLVRWHDNSVVTVASTCHSVQPITKTPRYSKEQKKKINVSLPHLVKQYNKFMGGTDRMDQDVGKYRVAIRGKKWWWAIFTWLLDVSLHNAWILHKKTGNDISQLDFRRVIVQKYLTTNPSPPKSIGRNPSSKTTVVRYDGRNHLVCNVPNKKRRRCAYETCIAAPRTMCMKCDVGLCIDCFAPYHNNYSS